MHSQTAHEDAVVSINPVDGSLLATYPFHTDEDIEHMLAAASATFSHWRWSSLPERAALLGRIADQLAARRDPLAVLVVQEMGKPITEAYAEVDKCVVSLRHFMAKGASYLEPDLLDVGGPRAHVSFEPLGPLLAIMPWNFPIWQFVRFLATAIMSGNVAILKHAENVQGCARALIAAVNDASSEPGLLQNLLVRRSDIGKIIADDRIAGITFTGSVNAGRIVAAQAGAVGKRAVLELGGSDPFIVLADADLDNAVNVAVQARFNNTGQSCICSKRFIIVDPVYDAFVERFVARTSALKLGDPMASTTQLGTIARADLREGLQHQLQASLDEGARMALSGGTIAGPGYFFAPVVLVDAPAGSTASREELFGPIAPMFRVRDEAEAIAKANDTKFGLGASVWTQDIERAARLTPQIEAGAVFVNDLVRSVASAPFGGIKDSGFGRELGQLGTREFTNQKLVWING